MLRLFVLTTGFALAAGAAEMTAQAARGKEIFFDASKKTQCATCHQLEGKGTAIGPDLTKIARLSPKAISVAILASRTVYAKEVELRVRKKFPAMIATETGESVKLFDLSKMPPEEMTLEKVSIHAIKDNATWRHPPESTGYNSDQLADVIAYIRNVSFGDTKGVQASEVK
ncbi:MAG: c-type cytochrome [Bryobacteraceae bacterium]|nr:c-type cytochrome [Bryobacteraceae bacterium]